MASWCYGATLARTAPARIVSINQCADELLLNLADRAQIQSVSHYVKNPDTSWDAVLAAGIPGNSGHVEEVISYDPDLVLVGDFNARSSVSLMRGLGLNVVELAHPRRLSDALEQIVQVADLVGQQARGEKLVQELKAALKAVPGETEVSAVVYQPNGFTTGRNSIVDHVMRSAGLRNIAAQWGGGGYSYFPMELLLLSKPDLLILDPQSRDAPSLAHQILDHPALVAHFGTLRTVSVPAQAWACGSHHMAKAVKLLRDAARPLRRTLF